MLPQIFNDVFENDGHGPLFRKDKMPPYENGGEGGGEGIPLLSLAWEMSSLDKPGFLRANVNHGLLTRESFPEAAAEIQRRYDAGDSGVVTDADWLFIFNATGMCARYSIGDGGSTFRIPYFGVNRASLAVAGDDFGVAHYRKDQMRPITGTVAANIMPQFPRIADPSSALYWGETVMGSANWDGANSGRNLVIDTTKNGSNYSGDITHGRIIGATPYIKMYGTVTESSDANMAALIAATTAKLDTAQYAADIATASPKTIAAMGSILGSNGSIVTGVGLNSSLRIGTGTYRIYSPGIKENSIIEATIRTNSGATTIRALADAGQADFQTINAAGALTDCNFYFIVMNNA